MKYLNAITFAGFAALVVATSPLSGGVHAQNVKKGKGEPQNVSLNMMQVTLVQLALNDLGFRQGNVDGYWDERSSADLQSYELSRGMKATGQLHLNTACDLMRYAANYHGSGSQIPRWCQRF